MTRKTALRLAALAIAVGGFFGVRYGLMPVEDPPLVYNTTPSVPRGLYRRIDAPLARGLYVKIEVPPLAVPYLAQRGYEGEGAFLKPVAALRGDRVCAHGDTITINGATRARRVAHDAQGRALPRWTGCKTLAQGEAFLLAKPADSLDSRYYGPVETAALKPVRPLWTF